MTATGSSARGGSQAGYAARFDPPLEKKHQCPVCLLALRDPIQTACGHRFCTGCVEGILRKARPRCPLDNEYLKQDEIFPDNFCKREVLSLTVLCTNKELGCSWRSHLKDLELHVTFWWSAVPAVFHFHKKTENHQQTDCLFRSVVCHLCNNHYLFSQQRSHYDSVCPEIEISCENNCGQLVKRREYQEHITLACQNVKLACKFVSVGCTFKGEKSEVDEHQSAPNNMHTELLLQQVESLAVGRVNVRATGLTSESSADDKQAVRGSGADGLSALIEQVEHLTSAVAEKDKVISDLQQEVGALKSIVEEMTKAIQQATSEITPVRHDLTTCSSQISAIEQKYLATQGKVVAMEHRQLTIEKCLSVRENALAEHDVRLLSLEVTSLDGTLRWKITEVNHRRSEAVAGQRLSMYSPPFFTSRSGYKMCARIYLNGDGMGKGSHLSLFFVIMKGEYDAILPWPFQQSVTFTLIDQEHRRHVSDTFQPDPASSSFQRPVDHMNVASGCPLFVPLEALETRGYVKEDTMFIRIAVDTKGLVHP